MPNSIYKAILLATFISCVTRPSFAAPPPPETTADQLQTLPGFKVELMLRADPKMNGSWISMAKDPKGRLLLAGQNRQPITRVTIKDGQVAEQEDLKLPVSEAMGMLFVENTLYVNGYGKDPEGRGVFALWRCRSSKNDDTYDQVEHLRTWKDGSGEHGAHGIVLGPDKKLYIVIGNFTGLPPDLTDSSPHRNYADDLPLPRAEDGNGFGAGKKPPGGCVIRLDLDGKNPELFASGQRNTYDIAFNADGELFGFDSDMEWDWGTPWYRPVRVFHAVSAGDTGFREGSAKWPEYYPDSIPAAVNIGIGCPTGVLFGYGAKYPAKYQKAYYILDWSYGRIIAVHLQAGGASYSGSWENFLAPVSLHASVGKTPLNLTDAVIGDDGAMYFTVGGRNTKAQLFRISYTGDEATASMDAHDATGVKERELRHKLEFFHTKPDAGAIDYAWQHLGNPDRFIRYAARIAIERQPVQQWRSRAVDEKQPQAALTALLALARLGGTEAQADMLKALDKFPVSSLSEPQILEKLRVIEVSISRQGKPSAELAKPIIAELDPIYPGKTEALNRELCQVLLALDAPNAIAKTIKLLRAAPTQEEQLVYIHHLRTMQSGWTPELRYDYFSWFSTDRKNAAHPADVLQWFSDVGIPYADGASFPRFIGGFYNDARKTLTPDEQIGLGEILAKYVPPGEKPKKVVKARPLVNDQVGKSRNFARDKATFEAAQCLACHRFANEGGSAGPDLTAVSSRFSRHDILESTIEPSKVVSEQYMNTDLRLKNGDAVIGRVLEETDAKVVIQPNPLAPEKTEVKKSDIARRSLSKLSPMPEGLVNTFSRNEILDLLAYIESGGKKDHPDFGK